MSEAAGSAPDASDLLVVGDVHLGRRPTGLDDALAEHGLTARDLSPAAALERLVEHALAHPPRAVLFAGDLVDQERDRFEAFGRLERAAGRLDAAGIPVLAVAGNHDGLVLPRLADRVAGVRLVGRDGAWERVELGGEGPPIDLLGRSFTGRHERACPLDHPSFATAVAGVRAGATAIGLLHADLDAPGSAYAPVSRERLERASVAAWFVGHVHEPDDLSGPRPIGYLGSLVGLDAGESGERGAWRARLAADGVRAVRVDLGPVRWERLDVPLADGEADDADAVHETLVAAAGELVGSLPGLAALRAVVVRARFTGRLARRSGVAAFVADGERLRSGFRAAGVPIIVERVADDTRPAVDLEALAAEPSPIGYVARRLAAIRDDRAGDAAAAADRIVERVGAAGRWRLDVDDGEEPRLPAAAALAERAAWRVLDELLRQRDEAGG